MTQLSARRGHRVPARLPRAGVHRSRPRCRWPAIWRSALILNVNGDGGQGEVGFNDARKFISYTGDAKLTFAMTRHLGVFTQYVYYHYQIPPDPRRCSLRAAAVAAGGLGRRADLGLRSIDKEKVTRDPR